MLAEKQVETMKSQLETLQGSLKEKTSSGKDLDHAIDQLKRSNLEVELMAKEKEVGVGCCVVISSSH